ncbi:MAG TPA: Tn3 family transposase [Solirubrobacteraceae bacterium]|jgi:TnpA family transposase
MANRYLGIYLNDQQNKGESLHALHDRIFHGNHGTVRLHTLERQSTQAQRLHLVPNAIIYWNTIYTQHALDDLATEPAGDERARPHASAV